MIFSNRLSFLQVPLCVPPEFKASIVAMMTATFCVALLIPAPWSVRLLACAAIAFAAWRTLAVRFYGSNQYGFMYVICDTEQHWWLQQANGDRIAATLRDDSFVHLHLVVLNLRTDLARRDVSFLLWGRQCGYPTFRRLRIQLLIQQRTAINSNHWPPMS